MSVQERRKYDPDCKRNAVRLTEEPGRAVVDVAEGPGIAADLLYRWKREQRKKDGHAFPGYGREALTPQEQKIRELGKKLRDAEMEPDILKKAMAISAGRRNEISIYSCKPLIISGEEDVPCVQAVPERILPLVHGAAVITADGKREPQGAHTWDFRKAQRDGWQSDS